MTGLIDEYRSCLSGQGYMADPSQESVVVVLSELSDALRLPPPSFLEKIFRSPVPLKGVYIQGSVGRGKTWLLDLFYEYVPLLEKRRLHFHEFMLGIHAQLEQLRGEADPLKKLAADFSGKVKLLCLDEFHVTDIADAMLLAGLLRELFAQGVVLVATSNTQVGDLYRDGLQRDRFLPAIDLLKKNCNEVCLDNGLDYREVRDHSHRAWRLLNEASADEFLAEQFVSMAGSPAGQLHHVLVHGRAVPVRGVFDSVVWFRFSDICGGFRSTVDFVEIAERFDRVIVEGVPVMDEGRDNEVRRFINLVDTLYDNHVCLWFTAGAPPSDLYTGRRLAKAFERTASRLIEMGKPQYLEKTACVFVSEKASGGKG